MRTASTRFLLTPLAAFGLLALMGSTWAQDPAPVEEPAPPATPAEPVLKVTVNGQKIFDTSIEEKFQALIQQRTRGMQIPKEQLEAARLQALPALLEQMIEEILMGEDMKAAQLEVPDEAYRKFYETTFEAQLMRGGMSRADVEQAVQTNEKISLEAYIIRESASPEFRTWVNHHKLVAKRYPKESAVSAEEIQARYDRDKEGVYTKQVQVEASHILIGFDGATTDEAKAAKKTEAQRVLTLCQADGADFAALAKEHSTGPSGPSGGSLGSFPRTGKMVEPFAKAAFELEVDGVSGVVETQFGYHIIKVTGRTEGGVVLLEEVKKYIEAELFAEKIEPLRQAHMKKLREAATITYPE